MIQHVIIKLSLVLLAAASLSGCAALNINNTAADSYGGSRRLVSFRTGGSFGGWGGSLSESFGTQTSTTSIATAWGGEQYIGFNIGSLFIDWVPTYFGVGKVASSNGISNAYFTSFLGLEAGISLLKITGFLPVEAYVGYDPDAELGFSTGSQSVFDGFAGKIGVALPLLAISPHWRLGVRAEVRKNWLNLNGGDSLGLGVSSWSYFGGISIMFSR